MKTLNTLSMMLLIGVFVMSCKPGYQEKLAEVNSTRVTQVQVQNLTPTKEPIPVVASGVLASKAQAMLSFKVGGVVDQVLVEEGQSFRKGQVLARLELTEIKARVKQARENVTKLERDQARIKRLYADTVATLEQLQDISTALDVAKSDLEIAEYNQAYALVVAKEDGKVMRKMAERGELIGAGSPAFQVAYRGKNNSHIVRIGVADRDVVKVQLGDSAQVKLDAYPGQSFTAYVSEIAEAADPMTGVFELELTMGESAFRLRNGFIAKLELYPSIQGEYYKVPMMALVEGNGTEAIIYTPDQNTVKQLTVHPTYITDDFFVVEKSEMTPGATIVTQGAAYAKPGEPVEFLND